MGKINEREHYSYGYILIGKITHREN
jgi:hypothetical protein